MPASLDHRTVRQRVIAARMLRGEISQLELGELLARDGIPKGTAKFLETAGRKDPKDFTADEHRVVPLPDKAKWSLARQLRVPEEWFTEPDADRLIGGIAPPELDARRLTKRLDEAASDRQEILAALRELQEQVSRLLGRLDGATDRG